MWSGRVMYHHPNNHVYIQNRKENDNRQLWQYDEKSKTIKSYYEVKDRKNEKRSLDFRSTHITIQNTDSRWYQMVTIDEDGHLRTDENENKHWYAYFQTKRDTDGSAAYRETTKRDEDYQQWRIVYADEWSTQMSGQSRGYGFPVDKDMQIRSAYGEKRAITWNSGDRIYLKKLNYDSSSDEQKKQVFRFNPKRF